MGVDGIMGFLFLFFRGFFFIWLVGLLFFLFVILAFLFLFLVVGSVFFVRCVLVFLCFLLLGLVLVRLFLGFCRVCVCRRMWARFRLRLGRFVVVWLILFLCLVFCFWFLLSFVL